MTIPDYAQLIRQLVNPDDSEREVAFRRLVELDEEAVVPLIEQFYAGVDESSGLAIIEVLGAIGGYEALQFLRDTVEYDVQYESWQEAAWRALQRNE